MAEIITGFFGDFERDGLPREWSRTAKVEVDGRDLSAVCVSVVETRSAFDMEPRSDGLARADPKGKGGVAVENEPDPKEASDQFRWALEVDPDGGRV